MKSKVFVVLMCLPLTFLSAQSRGTEAKSGMLGLFGYQASWLNNSAFTKAQTSLDYTVNVGHSFCVGFTAVNNTDGLFYSEIQDVLTIGGFWGVSSDSTTYDLTKTVYSFSDNVALLFGVSFPVRPLGRISVTAGPALNLDVPFLIEQKSDYFGDDSWSDLGMSAQLDLKIQAGFDFVSDKGRVVGLRASYALPLLATYLIEPDYMAEVDPSNSWSLLTSSDTVGRFQIFLVIGSLGSGSSGKATTSGDEAKPSAPADIH